jgi:hypothetical protein
MRKNTVKGDAPTGPFSEAAPILVELERVPTPCKGKQPIDQAWQKETPADARAKLQGRLKRLGGANVGVSCGPSGVAVVDVDDPRLIEPMLDRFGPTPLIVSTPRGGVHLYYYKGSSSVLEPRPQVRSAILHGSSLSRVGASDRPGAVQSFSTVTAHRGPLRR